MTLRHRMAGMAWLVAGLAAWSVAQETGTTNTPAALTPVVVEAQRLAPAVNQAYAVTNVHTATWTDVPVSETPLSVAVVPRQVIDDQNVDRLRDAYRNVSGVTQEKTQGYAVTFESAYVRGFDQRLYVDGVNFYGTPPINLAGVQQVEVLKGPSSALYGAMEVGGLINVIPKLPEFQQRTEIYGEAGSYGHLRGGVDSTGPLDSNLAYRVVVDGEDSDSFRDYVRTKDAFVAPSLTYVFPDQTRLTAWLWYQHNIRPNDDGVAFTAAGKPVEPISINRAGPDHNTQTIDDYVGGLQLDHPVDDNLSLSQKFIFHDFEAKNDDIRFTSVTSKTNTTTPVYDNSSFSVVDLKYVGDALWKFRLGDTENHLLAGFDLARSDYLYMPYKTGNLAPVSIFNPVYPAGPFTLVRGQDTETITEGGGVFAQEQMDAFDNSLHLLLGGREDYVHQIQITDPMGSKAGTAVSQDDFAPSWRAGIMYDVTSWMSPYVSVCHSFNPNGPSTTSVGSEPLPPTTGLEYEGGIKFSLIDKLLQLTTAAFQITKNHVAITDPNNPNFSLDGGEMRSQGFESDLIGQITPELQMIANYTYTDTKVIESSSQGVGDPFYASPNSGSLWLAYTFQDGRLRGLGAGAGVFASSSKPGGGNFVHSTYSDTFRLPGYAEVDTGAWYTYAMPQGRLLKFQVNVFNVFDRTYYESSANTGRVEPGAPLSCVAKMSVTF